MRFSALLLFLTPHRRVLMAILGLLLVGSLVSLLNPWIAGQFTRALIGSNERQLSSIQSVLLLQCALLAVKSVLSFATSYLMGATGETMTANLRTRLHDHLQALPMAYYYKQRPGDVLALLSNDASN